MPAGLILSVQSNQFCAVRDTICAVKDEKLCLTLDPAAWELRPQTPL